MKGRKNRRRRQRTPRDDGILVSYYHKLRHTYGSHELTEWVKGKRVKHWKMVYTADDQEGDEYIPIYYKNQQRWKKKLFLERIDWWVVGILIGIVIVFVMYYVRK